MPEKKYEDVNQVFWTPEAEKDSVSGVYKGFTPKVGANESNVYLLEKEGEGFVSVWGSTVIDTKMKLINVGDDIRIIYLGEKTGEGKGARTYKDFNVQKAILN